MTLLYHSQIFISFEIISIYIRHQSITGKPAFSADTSYVSITEKR